MPDETRYANPAAAAVVTGLTPGLPVLPPGVVTPLLPVLPPGVVTPLLPVLPPGVVTPLTPLLPGGITPGLPGGGGTGGGGTGTGGGGDGSVAGGGGGGGGFGGGPVNEPEVHRQLARILGTDFASRGDVISDAVSCGLGMQQALGSGVNAAAIAPSWCAWATPRQLNYTSDRTGLTFTGTLRDITFGFDYRVLPNLVIGLAFTPEDTKVEIQGVDASFRQTGFGGGPYLGWQIRPTTVFDLWAGYARLDRSFDILGLAAKAPVDRTFVSMNLTETINTPWMRILPRLTYFHARDQVHALTIDNIGFTLVGTNYDYSFTEGSIELNRDVWFSNGLLLQPFLRGTARYDMQRIADTISTINGDDIELERWHGQLRAGLRAQFGPTVQLSLSGGYLSFFTPGVQRMGSAGAPDRSFLDLIVHAVGRPRRTCVTTGCQPRAATGRRILREPRRGRAQARKARAGRYMRRRRTARGQYYEPG